MTEITVPIKSWFERQEERKRTLKRVCRENTLLHPNLTDVILNQRRLLWPYIVDDKHRLIFGFVSKAGSTNWKSAFLVLKGKFKNVEDVPGSRAHDPSLPKLSSYSPEGIRHRLQHYTKFIFVRDPLARVLSAYRSKFQQPNPHFQRTFGRRIIKLYRKNATDAELRTGEGVTFEEFARFVTDKNAKGKNMDGHWAPIHRMVLPCAVPFDFIGKLETAEEDAAHILKYVKVDHLIHFKETQRNTSHSQGVFDKFYDTLPQEYIEKLYRLYLLDFKLFGYTMVLNLKERQCSS